MLKSSTVNMEVTWRSQHMSHGKGSLICGTSVNTPIPNSGVPGNQAILNGVGPVTWHQDFELHGDNSVGFGVVLGKADKFTTNSLALQSRFDGKHAKFGNTIGKFLNPHTASEFAIHFSNDELTSHDELTDFSRSSPQRTRPP